MRNKTDDFNRSLEAKYFREYFPSDDWHTRQQYHKDFCQKLIDDYWKNPTDINGAVIKVGSKVAVSCISGGSPTLMVGEVTRIDRYKGIQVEEHRRTYGSQPGRKMSYGYPNRMVVWE